MNTCDLQIGCCIARPLFPFSRYEGAATSVIAACGLIAGSAAVGGGGLYTPVLISVGYKPDNAIPLAQVCLVIISYSQVLQVSFIIT